MVYSIIMEREVYLSEVPYSDKITVKVDFAPVHVLGTI